MTKMVVGKTIKMPCMRPGPCKYSDEMVYISPETLIKMASTAHGIPVVVDHTVVDTGNVETVVVGRVADMHGDGTEVHFVVDDSEAVKHLQDGWGVSTCYRITESGPGGTFNAIPYDREVLDARYEHLAIVANPRYEMAVDPVFYNSADTENLQSQTEPSTIQTVFSIGGNMFSKMFKSSREEVKLNDVEDLVFQKEDGKEFSIAGLIKQNAEDEEKLNSLQKRYNELEEKYNALMKKNEEDAEAKEKEEKENAAKKNEEDEKEKAEKEKEEKENSIRQNSLAAAHATAQGVKPPVVNLSLDQRVAAGKALYGSK
jgi:hypothetical protein